MIKCLKLSFELVLTLCIMMFGGCAEVDKNGENTGSAVAGDFTVP